MEEQVLLAASHHLGNSVSPEDVQSYVGRVEDPEEVRR